MLRLRWADCNAGQVKSPLTVFGRNAVDRYFSPAEIRGLLELTERLAA